MPDLTREEVERRLEELANGWAISGLKSERKALQTAQSLYAERDAQTERHKGEIVTCLRAMDKLEAERDALAAEVKRLEAVAEAAKAVDDVMPSTYVPNSEGCMKVLIVVKDAEALRAALAALDRGQA